MASFFKTVSELLHFHTNLNRDFSNTRSAHNRQPDFGPAPPSRPSRRTARTSNHPPSAGTPSTRPSPAGPQNGDPIVYHRIPTYSDISEGHPPDRTNMSHSFGSNTGSTANLDISADKDKKLDISDVKDLSDIDNLSAKQLKILLTRNCVNFKGEFEKEPLREKVRQLWIDHNERLGRRREKHQQSRSQDSVDDIDENQLCKICMEREIDCVLLECGHMICDVACGRKLSECPICRQNISRCVRTFRG